MARPIKKQFEFFRVNTSNNEKEDYLKRKFKMYGWGTYLLILGRIYGIKGYYCVWDEMAQVLFCDNEDELNRVKEVVECCFKIELFNREMFDKFSILTSLEIQKEYLELSRIHKRKYTTMSSKFSLKNS